MDNSYKNISNETNKNSIKDNLEKIILKKSKMNEFLKDFQNYKNQSNNTSLNKENNIFLSQSNTLEISKEYKFNNESNRISYILSSDKKEPNIINKNKLFKKEKIKIFNKDRKYVLTNNDLVSPRYSFNNKNIRTPKQEIKNKIKYKYINKKEIDPINIGSFSNTNKKSDWNLKKKKTCRTFRIITENNFYDHDNESLNYRKMQENTFNYDNKTLVKTPEANDMNVFFYNNNLSNRKKTTNHDIIIKTKKYRNLSLALNQRNSNIHKHKRIYSLNEELNRKNAINTNIYKSEKKKKYIRYNDLDINSDENINHENNGLEKDINYSLNNDVNNLTKSLTKNNNYKKKKIRCFSEDKAKTKKIKYNNVLKKFANNINFHDIEKIFYLDNINFNNDEIISEIEMNKNDNSNNIPDSLLMEIPEEDIQENENNNIIKKINYNNIDSNGEDNRKNIKNKNRKIELFLNDQEINFTTNNGQNGHNGDIEKIKNKIGTGTTRNKIKKISEYFHNNKRNNNNKNFNYICHTVRNNISNNKILFTDTKDKNENSNNNLLNKNKSKEQRYIKLNKHIEELKKEEEKVLILKEKYNNLINKLKSDINIFNNKKLNEIILLEKNKKEEIEKIKNEKNKFFKEEEDISNNNNEINKLKEQINKLKEEIKLNDDIYNIFTESFNKKLDIQNKINNDLELKIKIYKAIIENNENEYLNTNDINNLIINNNNKYQKTDRNRKQKAKNQKSNKNIENELCVQTIKNHIYNRTLNSFNSKYKNITNDINKNGITKSYKKNKNFQNHFHKNKNSELNVKINNNNNYNFTSNSNNNTKLNILHKKINKSGKNVLLTSNFISKSKNLNENNKSKKVTKNTYNTNSKKLNRTEKRFNKNKNYLEEIKNNTINNFRILLNTEKRKMNGFETKLIKKNSNLSKPKGKHRSSSNLNFINNKKDNIINNLIKKKDVNISKKNKKDLKKEKKEIYLLTQRDKEKENNNSNKDNIEKIKDDSFNNYEMVFSEKYHPKDLKLKIINQEKTSDGKIIIEYSNHKKEIIFNNKDNLVCTKKEIFDDGYQIIYFKNKDIKQIYPDGKEVYFFSENSTVATTLKNGDKIYKFSNGQIEKIFKNGGKTIKYPDGTIKNIYLNGEEEILYNDGSKQKKNKDGSIFVKYKEREDDIAL